MSDSQGNMKTPGMLDIYRDTIQPLYQFVSRRAGGSRQLAEDITQETYLRAVTQWPQENKPENALAWLQTVARNLLLNHYRRRQPQSLEASNIDCILDAAPVVAPDAAALVYWGLARLRRRPRRVLEAFYVEGRSTREIAQELGISERAVEGRLRRARQMLKKKLTPLMRTHGDAS